MSNILFGNGATPRKQYDDAILSISNLAHNINDQEVKEKLLGELREIGKIESSKTNYVRWAKMLETQYKNQLREIWNCIEKIKKEAR